MSDPTAADDLHQVQEGGHGSIQQLYRTGCSAGHDAAVRDLSCALFHKACHSMHFALSLALRSDNYTLSKHSIKGMTVIVR